MKTPSDEEEALLMYVRDRLVKERKKRGMTQREIARHLGVTSVHMCNLEKGNSSPSFDALYNWCSALGYEPKLILRKTRWGTLQ